MNINTLSKLSFLIRRYFWFLMALTSTQVSAITLGDFYLNERLNPILPSQQFSESENSSITVVYDLEDRNITNQEAKVEISGELSEIDLSSKGHITISLDAGTYNLSAWAVSDNKRYQVINLKEGQHKIWNLSVFEEHLVAQTTDVTISI